MLISGSACSSGKEKEQIPDGAPADTMPYQKSDLLKIKWIEGKWRGMDKDQPFYEIYRFANDSTLETLGYEWNGKDSSKTTSSFLSFKDGVYYLGKDQNWKVVSITDSSIKMLPNNRAANDILWTFKDRLHWEAVLTSSKGTVTYNMEHFDPFKK